MSSRKRVLVVARTVVLVGAALGFAAGCANSTPTVGSQPANARTTAVAGPATTTRVATTVATKAATTKAASSGLQGTTWKGGNMIDNGIVFSFTSATDCSITSMMYNGPCTYVEDGSQVSMKIKGTSYVFSRDASRMAGNYLGANIDLSKQ